ncbi:MAG: sigma factor, partial [Ktedonobacteraceae bacterium]
MKERFGETRMEDDIIQRAQRGDQRAFQQLVEGYSDLAWRTARVLLAERAAAEDAVQEAWLDTWRGLPRFQLARPF